MRAFKEQYDCQIEDFTVNEEYVEYKERQTKNRQGDEGSSRKRARKYNTKIWKTDRGERDPYRAFVEYVGHRPQGDNEGCQTSWLGFHQIPLQLSQLPTLAAVHALKLYEKFMSTALHFHQLLAITQQL